MLVVTADSDVVIITLKQASCPDEMAQCPEEKTWDKQKTYTKC